MKYRKLRIAWSVVWGAVAVLLCSSFLSCQQKARPVPVTFIPGPRDVDWKGSLGETLPAAADVLSITWNSSSLPQPVTIPLNDWPQLISALDESVPGSSGTTIPVIGTVEIANRDGQLVLVSVYDADKNAIVYQFHAKGDARSGREYYSSRGKEQLAKILPAIPLNFAAEPQNYVLHSTILGLAVLAIIAAFSSRARFSLRTLLIATTLVAVGLGVVVWMS